MKLNHKRIFGWLVLLCYLDTGFMILLGVTGYERIDGWLGAVTVAPFILVSPYMVYGTYLFLRHSIKAFNNYLDKL